MSEVMNVKQCKEVFEKALIDLEKYDDSTKVYFFDKGENAHKNITEISLFEDKSNFDKSNILIMEV